jgi:hypothetical protein
MAQCRRNQNAVGRVPPDHIQQRALDQNVTVDLDQTNSRQARGIPQPGARVRIEQKLPLP